MNRRRFGAIALVVAVAVLAALALSAGTATATDQDCTATVAANESIQDAVDGVSAGEIICVETGIYEENVTVSTDAISLQAADGHEPVIDGTFDRTVGVHLDGVTNVTLDGFELRSHLDHGVLLEGTEAVTVSDTTVTDADTDQANGIEIRSSSDVEVSGNTINDTDRNGIVVENSADVTVEDNAVTEMRSDGILATNAPNIEIRDNDVSTSGTMAGWAEITVEETTGGVLEDNVVSGAGAGVELADSSDIVVSGTVVDSLTDEAVRIEGTTDSLIEDTKVDENFDVAFLVTDESHRIQIRNSTVTEHTTDVLELTDSDELILEGNSFTQQDFSSNRDAIVLENSYGSVIANNSLEKFLQAGIVFDSGVDNATVVNNSFDGPNVDLEVIDSADSTVEANEFDSGIRLTGTDLVHYLHDISEDNTVDGDPVVYIEGETDPEIPEDAAQLIVANTSDATIEDRQYEGVTAGIQLGFVSDSTISSVSVENTTGPYSDRGGIDVGSSADIEVVDSEVTGASSSGVAVRDSPDTVLQSLESNESEQRGVYLEDSPGSEIRDGTVTGNSVDGVQFDAREVSISGITAVDNDADGIRASGSANGTITEVTARGNDGDGIALDFGTDNLTVSNSTATANDGAGVRSGAVDSTVTNNHLEGNQHGVRPTSGMTHGTVAENVILNSTSHGVFGGTNDGVEVLDNTIEGSDGQGMQIDLGAGEIVGNEIRDNQNGVNLRDGDDRAVTVADNVIESNAGQSQSEYGVQFDLGVENVSFENNTVVDHEAIGLALTVVEDITLDGNDLEGHDVDVHLDRVGNSTVANNRFESGVVLDGDDQEHYEQVVSNNTVQGDPLFYSVGATTPIVPESPGQIIVVDGTDVVVEDESFDGVASGVQIAYSEDATVAETVVTNAGDDGIRIIESDDTSLEDLEVLSGLGDGVSIVDSEDTNVDGATVSGLEKHGISVVLPHNGSGFVADGVTAADTTYGIAVEEDGFEGLADIEVTDSLLFGNERGIHVDADLDDGTVHDSSITKNEIGLEVTGSADLNATDNWWGDESGPSGPVTDPEAGEPADGDGDPIHTGGGSLLFYPWLDADPIGANVTLTHDPAEPLEGETVTFTANATLPGATPAEYRWNLSGETTTTVDPTVEHAFDEDGEHDASVTVVDDSGVSYPIEKTVDVEAVEPEIWLLNASMEPTTIGAGDEVTVEAYMENFGTGAGDLTVDLRLEDADYEIVDERYDLETVTVPAGEVVNVTITETFNETGEYWLSVGDIDEWNVAYPPEMLVVEEPSEAYIDVSIIDTPASVDAGERLDVTAALENVGTEVADQEIALSINGTQVNETDVSLGGDATENVTLSYQTSGADFPAMDVAVSSENTTATETVAVGGNGTISGVVSDGEEPIEGATVTADRTDGDGTNTTVTDSTGSFSLGVSGGTYDLTAEHIDHETETVTDVGVLPAETTVQNVTLEPDTGWIAGTITNETDGTPLDAAHISVLDANGTHVDTEVTGADGTYESAVAEGNYTLSIFRDGYQESISEDVWVEAGETTTVNESLEPEDDTGVVTGAVTNATDGTPIAGATVDAVDRDGIVIDTTNTDPDGSYALALEPDIYALFVSADGYDQEIADDVAVVAGDETTENVSLEPDIDAGVLAGYVTDEDSDEAIEDANVAILDQDGVPVDDVSTDPTGYYMSEVVPGTYDLDVSAAGYEAALETDFDVVEDELTMANVSLTTAANGTVTGMVTNESSGEPIAANVTLLADRGVANGTTTGADGSYTLSVEPGTYDVTVDAAGYGDGYEQDVDIESDTVTVLNVSLEPLEDSGWITGTVTNESSGEPIEGAQVAASGAVVETTPTDQNGSYTLTVPEGTYTLNAMDMGYEVEEVENVTVIENETTVENISLQPEDPEGVLEGTVTNESSDEPIVGANVTVLENGTDPVTSVFTDVSGYYGVPLEPGTYSLTVETPDYEDATVSDVDIVAQETTVENVSQTPIDGPSASLSHSPDDPVVGEEVTFDGADSTGAIEEYRWDLTGDGTFEDTTATPSTTYTYAADGTYTAILEVEDDQGRTHQDTVAVEVAAPEVPEVAFEWEPTEPVIGEEVTFNASASEAGDGNLTEYRWDVTGDGVVDETTGDPVVNYTYDAVDTYEVELVVEEESGLTNLTRETVTVSERPAPSATFEWSPAEPELSETVTLDASDSEAAVGSIVEYRWDLDGDGTVDEVEAEPTLEHSFETEGIHTVRLEVEDDGGAANETSVAIEVVGPDAPTADFEWEPVEPETGETVSFNASESHGGDGELTEYRWDFTGNGTVDEVTNASVANVTFTEAGTYAVELEVEADTGLTNSSTANLTVSEPDLPTVELGWTPVELTVGETVSFDAAGSAGVEGSIVEYRWDLTGDGSVDETTASPTVNHTYEDADTYDVTLEVEDEGERTNATTETLVVAEPPDPTAAFSWDPDDPDEDDEITFDASASSSPNGEIVEYRFDLTGDGVPEYTTADPTVQHTYDDAGTYTVSVVVEDEVGATDVSTETVVVRALDDPIAVIDHDPAAPTEGENVTFDGSNSTSPNGEIIEYRWDLTDDGSVDIEGASPVVDHTFEEAGTHTVHLEVEDETNRTHETSVDVVVSGPDDPTAAFVHDPAEPEVGDPVTFNASNSDAPDGTIETYRWDLTGDGEFDHVGSEPTVTHTYDAAGTYVVELEVEDDGGLTNTTTQTVDVSEKPTPEAGFTHSPDEPEIGENVTFDASNSTTPHDEIVEYRWDLTGDGSVDESSEDPVLSHSFGEAGEVTVTLEVEDDEGATNETTGLVFVTSPAEPTASVSLEPVEPVVNESVTFNASESEPGTGDIVSYRWDLTGDGTIDEDTSEPVLTHSYEAADTYDVGLEVEDEAGATATANTTVTVAELEPPVAEFDWEPVEPAVDETVTFNASESTAPGGTVETYRWDVTGDGVTDHIGSEPTMTHTYNTSGTYAVQLMVEDDDGLTNTTSQAVEVSDVPSPEAAVSHSPDEPEVGETVTLDASNSTTPNDDIVEYRWDLTGNGTVDETTTSPTYDHAFAAEGTYAVVVEIEDDTGATDTATTTVDVQEPPEPASFAVEIQTVTPEIEVGESVLVTAAITNEGDETGTETVHLEDLEGATVNSTTVDDIGGGTTATVQLSWDPEDADSGEVTVNGTDDSDTAAVTVLPKRTFSLSVPADGGAHTLAFPGTVDGTLEDVLGDTSGIATVYSYDDGWTQVTNFSVTPTTGDVFVLSTRADGPAAVELEVPLDLEVNATMAAVEPGWNLLPSAVHGPATDTFGDGLVLLNAHPGPAVDGQPNGDDFSSYVPASEGWGVEPPVLSPFSGYFVYYDAPGSIEYGEMAEPLVDLGYEED